MAKTVFNLSAEFDRKTYAALVQANLDKQTTVKMEVIPAPRTGNQNRYLWALYKLLSDHTGFTTDEVHELCKRYYAPQYEKTTPRGTVQSFTKSTADMNTKEMTDYIEKIRDMGGQIGCYLPTADEYTTNWRQIEAQ